MPFETIASGSCTCTGPSCPRCGRCASCCRCPRSELSSELDAERGYRRGGRTIPRPRPRPRRRPWASYYACPPGSVRTSAGRCVAIASPLVAPGPVADVVEPTPPAAAYFTPVGVEHPGGGRIRDKKPPRPDQIVTVSGVGGKRIALHRLAAGAWQALVAAARRDGIAAPLLLPTSGYREPVHQERLWRAALAQYGSPQEARKWVAPPGSSPHQTGRAIDSYLGGRNASAHVAQLRTLPAYRWLVANAVRFGFYPYPAEPWHWEYNPPASAATRELQEYEPVQRSEFLEVQQNLSNTEYVRWIQRSLNQILGLRLAEDGQLGQQTRTGIRTFQTRQGLPADAIVGPRTQAALIAAGASPSPIPLPPPIGPGPRCHTVDQFAFDSSALTPAHLQQIIGIAKEIVARQSTPQPIRSIYATGHTDPVGTAAYNMGLGLRRATAVRQALMRALDVERRGMSARMPILARSRGEQEPIFAPADRNRRVEVCLSLTVWQPPPKRKRERIPRLEPIDPRPRPRKPCDQAELSRRLRDCNLDFAKCVGKLHLSGIVRRLMLLGPKIPKCYEAIKSKNPLDIAKCAYEVGIIKIDEYFRFKNEMDFCGQRLADCRSNAKAFTHCP